MPFTYKFIVIVFLCRVGLGAQAPMWGDSGAPPTIKHKESVR